MCGIVGFFRVGKQLHTGADDELLQMCQTLVRRGPDSFGCWSDPDRGIALAHRRLAIQDLSEHGHQPMQSKSGRYVIVYNGEIYNFLEIKLALEKKQLSLKGHSDTEIILAAIDTWGIKPALEKFIGMFAFALWDKESSTLTLARDRMGEKPLYYGWQNDTFLFGSELKALQPHRDWQNKVDRDALILLTKHNFIPAPYSIFKNIKKLLPGSYLTLNLQDKSEVIDEYWSYKSCYHHGQRDPLTSSSEEIVNGLEQKLQTAIQQQMIADVPIGAFLSGGVDSSTVVSVMQSLSDKPIQTFTIGFHDKAYNEANYARMISQHLGTEHTELYVSENDLLNTIPKLADIYDEPFADSSQIPTVLISELARRRVTVSLSGDGGDELFCGYSRYNHVLKKMKRLQRYPHLLRKLVSQSIKSVPEKCIDQSLGLVLNYLSSKSYFRAGNRLHKKANTWGLDNLQAVYQDHISYWGDEMLVLNGSEPEYILNNEAGLFEQSDILQHMQYLDAVCYLADDILVKVDRAAMYSSLETRVPFLNHDIVEFAARIPSAINTLDKSGKWPLRQILYKYVDKSLLDRPKSGFAVPLAIWLRGPLRDWAESLLERKKLIEQGFFNVDLIQRTWSEHQNNQADHAFKLWGILMFQAWQEEWAE